METLRSSGLAARVTMEDRAFCSTALDLMRCILPLFTRLWISITSARSSGNSRLQACQLEVTVFMSPPYCRMSRLQPLGMTRGKRGHLRQMYSPVDSADEETWKDACEGRDQDYEPKDGRWRKNLHKHVVDGLGQSQGKLPIAQQIDEPDHCAQPNPLLAVWI